MQTVEDRIRYQLGALMLQNILQQQQLDEVAAKLAQKNAPGPGPKVKDDKG